MRLLALDLLAYGGFTDLRLDLSRTGAVHVLFGANEAGKSTTLRAVHALLYGIERQTPDAYLHAHPDLRLGARIVAQDGRELCFTRKKGQKGALLDAGGAELEEAVLARMLSGVSRDAFAATFGLDHARLRAGGEQLRQGRGELGETLFQAGAGAASIHRALIGLREQHEAIFTPRGKKQQLHDPLEAFQSARKRERDNSRSADTVLGEEQELEQRRREAAELAERRRACRTEQSQLQRALRVLPGLAKREALAQERAELGEAPELPEDCEARRTAAEQALSLCSLEQAQLAAQRAKLEKRRSQLEIVESLEHERADVINALKDRLAVTRSAEVDLPKRRGELRSVETKLEVALRALPPALAPAPAPAPAPALATPDPRGLPLDGATQQRFERAVRERGALIERLDQAEREARSVAQRLGAVRRLLAQLGVAETEVELEALVERLPAAATVAKLAERFERRDRSADALRERAPELDAREETATTRLDALARTDAPPTEELLEAARAERDALVRALREGVAEGRRPEVVALDAIGERIARADQQADRMRREAARVAQHAELLAEQAAIARERTRLSERWAQHAQRSSALDDAWRAAWAACGITPREPGEMQALHARLSDLRGLGEQSRAADHALAEARRRMDAWEQTWSGLTSGLGLPADAGVEEAQAVVEKRREIGALAAEAEGLRHRIEAMVQHAESLAADARELIERHAPPLAAFPIDRAIERLVELHARTVRDVGVRAEIADELLDLDAAEAALAARRDEAESALAALLRGAGVASVEALQHQERRLRRARELERALAEVESELLGQGEGGSLERLVRETQGLAADSVHARLAELEPELQQIDDEHEQKVRAVESLELRRTLWRGGAAADAALEVQEHLARVRELAREWARKRLAAELLQREIRRYCERNQGPVLARAEGLFARISLGHYPRLQVAFDDAARPVLQCLQGGTRALAVEALSDGARDQLYLALRIASLEHFATRSEPLPLLLDDVLINFDDERASATFAVLGELAESMQVLFFTHHVHHLELARRALGAERVVAHHLTRALPVEARA